MTTECMRVHEDEFVHVQGSDVYFHCEVCETTVLELNLKLKKLELELLHKYLELGIKHRPEIRIFIRSDGGPARGPERHGLHQDSAEPCTGPDHCGRGLRLGRHFHTDGRVQKVYDQEFVHIDTSTEYGRNMGEV